MPILLEEAPGLAPGASGYQRNLSNPPDSIILPYYTAEKKAQAERDSHHKQENRSRMFAGLRYDEYIKGEDDIAPCQDPKKMQDQIDMLRGQLVYLQHQFNRQTQQNVPKGVVLL